MSRFRNYPSAWQLCMYFCQTLGLRYEAHELVMFPNMACNDSLLVSFACTSAKRSGCWVEAHELVTFLKDVLQPSLCLSALHVLHDKCEISYTDVHRLVPSGVNFDLGTVCLQVRKFLCQFACVINLPWRLTFSRLPRDSP